MRLEQVHGSLLGKAVADSIGATFEGRTQIKDNEVTVQIKPSYYLHGQFIIRIDSKSSGKSTLVQL